MLDRIKIARIIGMNQLDRIDLAKNDLAKNDKK
jgi:hypothetical protein